MIDLHCLCLPGVDDGCKTKEESLALLRQSKQAGIDTVFATPHYYRRESVSAFLSERQAAFAQIAGQLASPEYPEVILGAEVAYFTGITNEEALTALCLGKSDYLLLELPTSPWTPQLFRDLYTMSSVNGIRLILAHVERYIGLQDKKAIRRLYEMELMIQMNVGALLRRFGGHSALQLLKDGKADLLGSDAHDLRDRPQNLPQGCQLLSQKCPGVLSRLCLNAEEIADAAR